jgi:hypothetical protein
VKSDSGTYLSVVFVGVFNVIFFLQFMSPCVDLLHVDRYVCSTVCSVLDNCLLILMGNLIQEKYFVIEFSFFSYPLSQHETLLPLTL